MAKKVKEKRRDGKLIRIIYITTDTNQKSAEFDICPICKSELGHKINCPRGIAKSNA